MKLTQKQQETQDAILLAVHEGCSLEEARDKEVHIEGCIVRTRYNDPGDYSQLADMGGFHWVYSKVNGYGRFYDMDSTEKTYEGFCEMREGSVFTNNFGAKYKIASIDVIGLPPTLSRVLHSLKGVGIFAYMGGCIEIYREVGCWRSVCPRKLLSEDGTAANLRDQSEETQDAIHDLLCKKTEGK